MNRKRIGKRLFAWAALCLLICAVFGAVPRSFAAVSRRNYLRTSYHPEAYTLFEIVGDQVTAVGVYKNDRIRRITSPGDEIVSMRFSAKADGSFESVFGMGAGGDSSLIRLEFDSGAVLSYRIDRDDGGWYFPENGLSETNRAVFEHIYDAPAEAALYYLTASGEAERASEVRDQLRRISDSVTEGIEGDYEKARAVCAYVASRYYYDHDARNTSVTTETYALENVLKNARTVCTGFANLTCALLQAQGIDAVAVKGGVASGGVTYEALPNGVQNHEFTAFWYAAEERWVWMDACWNGSGNYMNGEYVPDVPHEKYFDISDDALAQNHRADYAERRSFFDDAVLTAGNAAGTEAPPEAPAETGEENPAPKEEETTEQTESPAADGTAPQKRTEAEPAGDNTALFFSALFLGIGVIALCVYLIGLLKKQREAERKPNMVIIELENGKQIKIELYPDIAPITVKNFEELVAGGFYDGLTFHRVISGFMIQGGCPIGNGTGNSGKHIKGEFRANGVENDLRHTRGVVSMARAADPDSASCQFFIMHEDAPHLDGSYAAFGKVVEGMDAVDEIARCETDYADMPLYPIVMKSVRLVSE